MKHEIPLIVVSLLLSAVASADEISPSPPSAVAPAATPPPSSDPVIARATALLDAGKLLGADAFAAQMQTPQSGPVALATAATAPLTGREIARRAAAGYLRAGWFFQCTKCGRWHTNFAGGYAIANNTAATAHHVMQPPENMKPGTGYPIVVRGETDVMPITAVLAADATVDAVILRVSANDLKPLPLASDVQVGDPVWCLSDPRGERGYFSNGIVNRFVPHDSKDPRQQRISVSTDWAPGSSGAAVLDVAGNVIGHVGTIRALFTKPPTHGPDSKAGASAAPSLTGTAMNLHEAIPAKSVLALLPH